MARALWQSSEALSFVSALAAADRLARGPHAAVTRTRQRRLDAVLAAARKTPSYQDRLATAGQVFSRIAPMSKSEWNDRLDDSFSVAGLHRTKLEDFVRNSARVGELFDGKYLVAKTSGTTGQVGIFVNDLRSWALTRGITFARLFRDDLNVSGFVHVLGERRYRMAFVVAAGGHYMTFLLASRVPRVGRLFTETEICSVEAPISSLVQRLNRAKPHLLHSYPSILELLCLEQRAGRLQISPEVITAGSEPITPSCRLAVAVTFPRARLVETYAATECVPMATSCRLGTLHVNEDACILEPVDRHGHLVAPGTLSTKVLLTNLLNHVQPIVRFELTDQVRLLPDRCPCGSPFVAMEVQGRSDDTFYLRGADDAYQAHAPIPLELVFLRIEGLLQYQLVHEEQNQLRIRIVPEQPEMARGVQQQVETEMQEYLDEHGLRHAVRVHIEVVATIERDAESKKVRQIWSRVPRPNTSAVSASLVRGRHVAPRREEPV